MIIVSNPRGDQAVAVPQHDDGSAFRFEMICDDAAKRVYADTWTELVEALITGYADVSSTEEADQQRLLYAVRSQVELQAAICAGVVGHKFTDDEIEVLLGDRHDQPRIGLWTSPIPLVLVTSYYQPIGEIDRPVGRPPRGDTDSNLIWLDPTDEQTLVETVAEAGIVILAESNG